MNTKNVLIQKLIAMIIVFVIVISNLGVIGGEVIAYADTVKTSNKNITFVAYFEDENGNMLDEIEDYIGETLILKIDVTVSNDKGLGGYFDGTINIEESNFKLVDDSEISVYVEAGYSKTIEREIEYQSSDNVTAEYLAKSSKISITGTYTNSKKDYEIEGETSIAVSWKTSEETTSILKASVLTNKEYTIGEETKRLVQVYIGSKLSENTQLADMTEITITVPEGVEEVTAHRRTTSTDTSENLTYNFDSENNLLTINSNSNGSSDLIVVTYKYAEGTEISDTLSLTNKITTYDGAERSAETTVEISDEKDGIVSTDISQDEDSIYKGKLYTGEDRTYDTTTKINIDLAEAISSIDIKENAVKYVSLTENEDGEEETEEKSASITYVKTTINKDKFLSLFGEDGYIIIKDQDGNTVVNITSESETNDDGDIEITYNSVTSIEIITSTPQREGILEINHEKKIAESKYSRDEIEELTAIKESNKTINEENETANTKSSEIELKETESVANIKLEDSTISTTEDGQSLIIRATLDTSDESKDLYKNPTVKITLPEGITNIEIEQAKALYRNGLKIKSSEISKNDTYELYIEFEGEQENYDTNGGLQIYINLNIEVDKTTTTHSDEIKMTYTNENKDVTKTATASVEFESKYGLMLYNVVSNYSENGEKIDIINDEDTTLELDTESDSREMRVKTYLINNHDKSIQDVVYIGTIPSENDNNTFTTTLKNLKISDENVKIYYSTNVDATEDDESWTEDSTDAKAYKIVIDEMEAEDVIEIITRVEIPETLSTNQEGEITEELTYSYNGVEQTRSATINLMTEYELVVASAASLTNGTETEVEEGITVTVNAVTANEELSDGDSIYEGETVKYYITIANNTNTDYTNISTNIVQTNGKVWGIDVRNEYNAYYGEYRDYSYYDELDTSELELDTIEELASGESVTLEYEAYANTLEECDGTTMYGTISITSEDETINTSINTIENEIQEAEITLEFIQTSPINEYVLYAGDVVYGRLDINNITDQSLTNVTVTLILSDKLNIEEDDISAGDNDELEFSITNTQTSENGETIYTINISEISANSSVSLYITPLTSEMEVNEKSETASMYAMAQTNANLYISNGVVLTAYQFQNDINVTQTVTVDGTEVMESAEVENGSKLIYTGVITNNETNSLDIAIEDYFNTGMEVETITLIDEDGNEEDVTEYIDGNSLYLESSIDGESEITLVVEATLDADKLSNSDFTNMTSVTELTTYSSYSSTITLTSSQTTEETEEETTGEDTTDTTDGENTTNQETTETSDEEEDENTSNGTSSDEADDEVNTYTISGLAWLDSDEDGERDSEESTINGIVIRAIDVSTGEIIDTTTSTTSDGTYELTLDEGKYIILFLYDTDEYKITEYQATGVSSSLNSDAISNNVYVSDETIEAGATDELTLSSDLTNIDIGLVEKTEANLNIAKYVTKMVVTNDSGTKTYDFDDELTLAKIEIASKYLSGSSVVVEYTMEVTNLGDATGYIGIIEDYLPSELSFSTSLNSDWYQSGENIYNNTLANEEIEPGETKTVTLTLTKTMTESNTGLINNIVGLLDDDGKTEISTASADVIIAIKTGAVVTYITLTLVIILVIFVIAYFINKKIMINQFNNKDQNNKNET